MKHYTWKLRILLLFHRVRYVESSFAPFTVFQQRGGNSRVLLLRILLDYARVLQRNNEHCPIGFLFEIFLVILPNSANSHSPTQPASLPGNVHWLISIRNWNSRSRYCRVEIIFQLITRPYIQSRIPEYFCLLMLTWARRTSLLVSIDSVQDTDLEAR